MILNHGYIPRLIQSKLLKLFKNFPIVVVSGARQVGKSTLLEELMPGDLKRVVFDPIEDVQGARHDPDLFLRSTPTPVILDEIQYVPALASAIKRKLETDRTPSQYLITGSQQWEVLKNLKESLAGRVAFLDLDGFSLLEIQRRPLSSSWLQSYLQSHKPMRHAAVRLKSQYTFFEQIWRGFYPETFFLDKDVIPDFYRAYLRTYIERDVRLIAEVADLDSFGKFYKLCAALSAEEINYSQMGRELGLSPKTAQSWLVLLKATFQWNEISAYSGNTIKRLSSKPKGYLSDAGMICHALAIPQPESIVTHPKWGHIFETVVVNEIRKQIRLLPAEPALYHWRTSGGAEVDLILEYDGWLHPIEIKAKTHPTKHDAQGLLAFIDTYKNKNIAPGIILSPAETTYALYPNILVVPWDG